MVQTNNIYKDTKKLLWGNASRHAPTWIGGNFVKQRPSHIPGYNGHVIGLVSENVYGNSFAKNTAKCLSGNL